MRKFMKLLRITIWVAFMTVIICPGRAFGDSSDAKKADTKKLKARKDSFTILKTLNFVRNLPLQDFNNANPNLKAAVVNELNAILDIIDLAVEETDETVRLALNQDAVRNLIDLKIKNEGCRRNGTPHEGDLVVNCTSQKAFNSLLDKLIKQLKSP